MDPSLMTAEEAALQHYSDDLVPITSQFGEWTVLGGSDHGSSSEQARLEFETADFEGDAHIKQFEDEMKRQDTADFPTQDPEPLPLDFSIVVNDTIRRAQYSLLFGDSRENVRRWSMALRSHVDLMKTVEEQCDALCFELQVKLCPKCPHAHRFTDTPPSERRKKTKKTSPKSPKVKKM